MGLILSITGVLAFGSVVCAFVVGKSRRLEIASFSALGLVIGFMIGLSESPIVAASITGGITFAGVLIGKVWDQTNTAKKESKMESKSEIKTESKTDTGTTTKAESTTSTTSDNSPISVNKPFEIGWLLPLCATAFLGVILGVGTRINDVLNHQNKSISTKLQNLGFDETQTKAIMNRMVEQMEFKQILEFDLNKDKGSSLRANEVVVDTGSTQHTSKPSSFDWAKFWKTMPDAKVNDDAKAKANAKYIVDHILDDSTRKVIPSEIRSSVEALRKNAKSDVEIVNNLKFLTGGQQ